MVTGAKRPATRSKNGAVSSSSAVPTGASKRARTEARKNARHQTRVAAEERNRRLRAEGKLTPHEEKKAARVLELLAGRGRPAAQRSSSSGLRMVTDERGNTRFVGTHDDVTRWQLQQYADGRYGNQVTEHYLLELARRWKSIYATT